MFCTIFGELVLISSSGIRYFTDLFSNLIFMMVWEDARLNTLIPRSMLQLWVLARSKYYYIIAASHINHRVVRNPGTTLKGFERWWCVKKNRLMFWTLFVFKVYWKYIVWEAGKFVFSVNVDDGQYLKRWSGLQLQRYCSCQIHLWKRALSDIIIVCVTLASRPVSQTFSKKLLFGMLISLKFELNLDTGLTIQYQFRWYSICIWATWKCFELNILKFLRPFLCTTCIIVYLSAVFSSFALRYAEVD
jgi:hypothetical protein